MTELRFDPTAIADLASAQLGESAPPARVISGAPTATELVLREADGTEIGVWEITPGSFHSAKHGISEFMYFLSGAGTITRASGEVVTIAPGAYVSLPDGSEVIWDVHETTRKLYIITTTTA
ncbi:cupin domain-containing protein [Leucobacter chromiireducens]|uniref:cupin domain-containing protein n=1 Tax=Leucobacter chromiireducens TaxID=283877 RepID=UPI000F630A67|nr:cupin domain-containing protein [Leucobacter chromiireducens]